VRALFLKTLFLKTLFLCVTGNDADSGVGTEISENHGR